MSEAANTFPRTALGIGYVEIHDYPGWWFDMLKRDIEPGDAVAQAAQRVFAVASLRSFCVDTEGVHIVAICEEGQEEEALSYKIVAALEGRDA